MDWLKQMNEAIAYMEEHMIEGFEIDEAARIACCNSYHFQRMFTYIANLSLTEYIRRRKMSLAAVELQNGAKVIDVAMKYGYESPTAFNRAFQSIHQVPPKDAKKEGTILKVYPPISFHITIKGDYVMDYRIEKKEAIRIVGKSMKLEKELEKNFETVPKMWGKAAMDGTFPKLTALMNGEPQGLLGVSMYDNPDDMRYYIAVASDSQLSDDLEEAYIPAATWAVFPGSGTSLDMQDHERRIITEWLPNSGYEYGNAPDVEVYLQADPSNVKYEVWIPVIRKESK